MASAVAGAVLAVIFFVAFATVKANLINAKRDELKAAANIATQDSSDSGELEELVMSYPDLSATLFNVDGSIHHVGAMLLPAMTGFVEKPTALFYGVRTPSGPLVVAVTLKETNLGLHQLALTLALLWLPLVVMIGGATWLAANAIFLPLERMSAQAGAITSTDLSERILTQDKAEFGALATQLNQMLSRIEASVLREEQFVVDAAHELRTPLSVLRTQIDTTLLKPRGIEEYVASHRALLKEVESLISLSEALLVTTKVHRDDIEPMNLQPLLEQTVERWHILAGEKTVVLQISSPNAVCKVLPEELRIILDNLIENAVRHSLVNGQVTVSLETENEQVNLRVIDNGPGIPAEFQEKVFERLFRVEQGRDRESGGFGIGLSVVKRLVAFRHGTVTLSCTGSETCFSVSLPLVSGDSL